MGKLKTKLFPVPYLKVKMIYQLSKLPWISQNYDKEYKSKFRDRRKEKHTTIFYTHHYRICMHEYMMKSRCRLDMPLNYINLFTRIFKISQQCHESLRKLPRATSTYITPSSLQLLQNNADYSFQRTLSYYNQLQK